MNSDKRLLQKIKDEIAEEKGDDYKFSDAVSESESDWNVESLVDEVALRYGDALIAHERNRTYRVFQAFQKRVTNEFDKTLPDILRQLRNEVIDNTSLVPNIDRYRLKIDRYVVSGTLNFKILINVTDMLSPGDLSDLLKHVERFGYKGALIRDGEDTFIQAIHFPIQDNLIRD